MEWRGHYSAYASISSTTKQVVNVAATIQIPHDELLAGSDVERTRDDRSLAAL